jgi:hypothetical protein
MVHRRADGSLAVKPVVELNVRLTMGRIAWEWMKRGPGGRSGRLRLLRRRNLTENELEALINGPGVFLNDPAGSTTFLAHWQPFFPPSARTANGNFQTLSTPAELPPVPGPKTPGRPPDSSSNPNAS